MRIIWLCCFVLNVAEYIFYDIYSFDFTVYVVYILLNGSTGVMWVGSFMSGFAAIFSGWYMICRSEEVISDVLLTSVDWKTCLMTVVFMVQFYFPYIVSLVVSYEVTVIMQFVRHTYVRMFAFIIIHTIYGTLLSELVNESRAIRMGLEGKIHQSQIAHLTFLRSRLRRNIGHVNRIFWFVILMDYFELFLNTVRVIWLIAQEGNGMSWDARVDCSSCIGLIFILLLFAHRGSKLNQEVVDIEEAALRLKYGSGRGVS